MLKKKTGSNREDERNFSSADCAANSVQMVRLHYCL